MSNCLDLHNQTVTFTAGEIDLHTLRRLVEESEEADKGKYKEPLKYLVQWFVAANTTFTDTSATVRFGCGNSSHTFRDFRQTINLVFKPLMKRRKRHVFVARDAENPGEGWFNWTVDFQKGVQ